jgi:hypothetical protein
MEARERSGLLALLSKWSRCMVVAVLTHSDDPSKNCEEGGG